MIKFDKKEIKYIKESFRQVATNTIEKLDKMNKEEYESFIGNIGEDSLITAKEITNNPTLLDKVNTDIELNKKVADAIYWIDGLWVWVDSCFTTGEEMAEYINVDESCSIFEKIMNEETEDGKETSNQKGVWKWMSELANG